MKVLFIEAKKNQEILSTADLADLPRQMHILYTIQYKNLAEQLKKKLGKRVLGFNQVLGCSKITPKAPLLLIGSGRFHATQLALSSGKPVYIYESKEKISEEEILKMKAREKGKYLKFLASNSIGIIFSLKPGQNKIKNFSKIKKKLQNQFPEKKFYSFIADNLLANELENFQCFFINTACPGLSLDSARILNIQKIKK